MNVQSVDNNLYQNKITGADTLLLSNTLKANQFASEIFKEHNFSTP